MEPYRPPSAVGTAAPGPRAHLESRLASLRQTREDLARQTENQAERLTDLRRLRARSVEAASGGDRDAAMLAEVRAIKALPQVVHVDIQEGSGRSMLTVDLRPMTLGRHFEREHRGLAVLMPLRMKLLVGDGGPLARIEDLHDAMIPAAHVRHHEPCLGNVGETLRDCLAEGHYAQAVQLMIGFLQTYDRSDPWGAVGRAWPSFDVEAGAGNVAVLPDPPRADARPADTPDAADPADAADQAAETPASAAEAVPDAALEETAA